MEKLRMSEAESLVFRIIYAFEIIVAAFIMIGIFCTVKDIAVQIFHGAGSGMNVKEFNSIMADALTMVVGLEFVKLLIKNTPEMLTTVLLLAISRQMVVEHLNMYEIVAGILALGMVFAIRKYLVGR